MDTGTPVIEDYADKMPFKFTGTIEKVVVRLGEQKLTPAEEHEVEEVRSRGDMEE